MTSGSSRAFRRWCAATTLLVVSWSLPGSVEARVSPMEIVKQQLRKPNFLIMVESPESMQGLPGENPARYNEVGADCQNGDRYCRLYGQPNRCEFSGMGGQGYKFDTVSVGTASQTQTQSQTVVTSTMTVTQTGVGTFSTNPTALMTGTASGGSAIVTATSTVVTSQSATGTTTASGSGTGTVTQTGTQSTSSSQTGTQSASQSSSASQTNTQATTQTSSSSQSGTQSASQSVSASQTNTQAGTQSASASQTNTQSESQTISASQTSTQTSSQSSSSSQSATQTSTQSSSSTASKTQTSTQSSSSSQTTTQTAQQSSSYSQTATQTSSQSSSSSASGTQTSSQSSSSSASGTQTASSSSSSSGSKTQTSSQSSSSSASGTQTASQSSSSSASGTQTASSSSSSSSSAIQTASSSSSSSASATQTSSNSSSSSASGTQTASQSGSSSASGTQTASQSSSSSASATQTSSNSSSSSASSTQTSTQSSSRSASGTQTSSNSSSSSASSTQTSTQSRSYSDSNSANGTQTYTMSQSQATTSTASGTYFKIGTDASILGYWPLEENVANSPHIYNDDSGNSNDGTAYGYPELISSPSGHLGNAGNFGTGSTDYVQVPTLTSAGPNMTVAVWIDWLGTFDVNTRQDFVSFTPGGEEAGGGIRLFVYGGNFYFDNNTALNADKSPAAGKGVWGAQAMNNNTWVLLVGVVDGTNWKLYQYWSSCFSTGSPSPYSAARSGATFNNSSGATWCFGGTCTGSTKYPLGSVQKVGMDEIRIWNRALSTTEISNLCNYNYVKTAAPTGTATSSYTQNNNTSTGSLTSTRAGTSSFSDTQTQTETKSLSSSASSSASSTYTNTSSSSSSSSSTFTNTTSKSSSASATMTSTSSSSSSGSSTFTNTSSSSSSASSTYTNTSSSSASSSATMTSSASASSSGSSTFTNTSSSSSSGSTTFTNTSSNSASASGTMTNSASSSSSASSTYTNTSSSSSSGSTTYTNTSSNSSSASGTLTSSVSSTSSASSTNTSTSSAWSSSSSTYTNTGSDSLSSTATMTSSVSSSASSTSALTNTASSSVSGSSTLTTTGSSSQSSSASFTGAGTSSASSSGSYTYTGTSSQSSSATYTGTGTSSLSSIGTLTTTGTSSVSASATITTIGTSSGSASITGTSSATQAGLTSTATNSVIQSSSATGTVTETGNPILIVSYTDLASDTQSVTGTLTLTATVTAASTLKSVPDLDDCTPSSCTWASGVSTSYCYLNSSVQCYSNDDCYNLTKGDFCRYISTDDGSGRFRNDFCASGATKTCRYQATTPCNSDSQCDSGKGDYCVFGKPANMCQKTGLWCTDDGLGCDSSSGDACVPATSRMMMVKNAVRRVVLEHAYDDTAVVKIGQMHTYQAGNGSTDNLFPYVKLNTTSTGTSFLTSTRVDTKFLPRSELLKGVNASGKACFSSSTGPSSTCTIDYSGGGASVNTPTVTYSLQSSGNDSRYAVPSGDGKTYYRQYAPWSSCGWMCYFAGAGPSGGEGIYEGSYYTFSYIFGTPVVGTPSDPAGTGSLYAPKYSTTYLGKSYGSAGNYWYLMDAERTEFVNENKYGAREFSGLSGAGAGLPWSQGYVPTGDEYPLPLTGASGDPTSTSLTCGAANGAQWDHNVVPMVNDTSFGGNSSLKPTQKALMNAARLDKASYGGFYATGNLEPIACALKNDGQNDKYHSIDNYMSIVQSSDSVANGGTSPCWENHVLMVVDGLPRGPGDVAVGGVDCSAAACTYDPVANPNLNGCNCPAVTKARALAANGVNVHVIAATTDLTGRNTYAAATLNNVARAGSTSPSFINIPRYAASEDELYYWLNYEMKEALRVTAATTPASAASGSQSLSGVTAGNMLFQTTVELPEWRGSLVGFSIGIATATTTTTATASVYTTQLAWDATTVNAFAVHGSALSDDEQKLWKQRHVFFSNATGAVHQITVTDDEKVDSSSKTALGALGMGGNPDETERIVLWMLGKIDASDTVYHRPLNPAVMGSVVNSMPIDVGSPGTSLLPGGNRFYWDHVNRSELVYLGADDGMLHAFYASNGKEAFAFIPADMVPMIAKIYAQGGQRYSPSDHIYGLAGSPKVKNLCVANCKVASNLTCSDDQTGTYNLGCPDWRTILVMGEGPGGNHPFALDITEPVESGAPTLKDASLLWHVGYKNASGISASDLGETDSVPAFAFHRTTNMSDSRVLMASGYPFAGSSTTTKLIDAMVWDGSTPSVAGPGATISGSGGCDSSTGQEFAVVADVAVARDNFHNGTSPTDQNLLAAYVADTWGKLHQYAPSYSPVLDKGGVPLSLGCTQPLHFSPAVVQLNRNNSNDPDNSVYLGQVTNSILDPNTVGSSFPASMLVVAKLTSIGSAPPALEQTFGSSGLIKLVADDTLTDANRLCGVTTVGKTSAASTCGSGGSWLPATARPTGTPVAVVRTDGTGFQLFTTWYDPPKANWDNCPESSTNGNSYVTLHEFLSAGTWAQIAGREYPNQYVTGVQFVGTTIFITFGTNATTPNPTTDNFGQNFQPITPQSLSALSGDRFIPTAWTERMDAE